MYKTFLNILNNDKFTNVLNIHSPIEIILAILNSDLNSAFFPATPWFVYNHHSFKKAKAINILGQKRNAAYKTYIVYGGLSPISSKRFVTVKELILGV